MNSKSLSNARNVSMYTKIDVDMQENLMSVQYWYWISIWNTIKNTSTTNFKLNNILPMFGLGWHTKVRTWKRSYRYIFDVFTSDILNLGFCLKPMSTLGSGFTSYSIIGSSSNFRLPKLKMANNKKHYIIQDVDCCRFSVKRI